jgi:DNA-binding beta-propeller fold protein YncE
VNGPHEIDVSPNSERAYVANAGGGPGGAPGRHVSALDLRARVTIANHALGSYDKPHDVRVARDGSMLWVACAPAEVVLEIDARSGALRKEWRTPLAGGWFVAVTPDENKLYVPHLEGKGVTVIDRRSGTVRTVLTGGAQSGIDISPDGREVWVIDHERQRINIVSVDGDRIAAGIDLRSSDFGRLRFTPDGRRVVLVQGKRAALFEAAERREVAAIDMTLAGKVVAVSPASDRAIVSNPSDGRITVLALSPLRVLTSVAVGKTPDGVAWLR